MVFCQTYGLFLKIGNHMHAVTALYKKKNVYDKKGRSE